MFDSCNIDFARAKRLPLCDSMNNWRTAVLLLAIGVLQRSALEPLKVLLIST